MTATHPTRSGSMKLGVWNSLAAAAALVCGLASCTDPTVAPKRNVTGANFFVDPS